MSEYIKLVIEIPKEDIEFIRKTSFIEDEKTMFKQSPSDRQGTMTLFRLMDSIKNGIPLDDVKGEWILVVDSYYEDGTIKENHWECSKCGSGKSGWGEYKFCPDCGADMRGKNNC